MLARRLVVLLSFALLVLGNDGSATSTPAGGIQLTREPRISMEKERLTIRKSKITVEYEFLNTSDRDITTEVAFPVPPYQSDFDHGTADMEDFRVWVGGQTVKYQIEAKAVLGSKDHTALLEGLGVDVATFGHLYARELGDSLSLYSLDIQKLPRLRQIELVRAGLIDREGKIPTWTVHKMYHWKQTFPPHQILRIRHEYKPIVGIAYATSEVVRSEEQKLSDGVSISEACVDQPLQKTLLAGSKTNDEYLAGIRAYWIDYILTTANTWKTPIKDFELVIERPNAAEIAIERAREQAVRFLVSLCWDGKLEQRDPDHFIAKKTNFVPTKELRVMFFEVPK